MLSVQKDRGWGLGLRGVRQSLSGGSQCEVPGVTWKREDNSKTRQARCGWLVPLIPMLEQEGLLSGLQRPCLT